MAKPETKKRLYRLDGDTVEITFVYNKELDRYFGSYPDFSEEPRYTHNGCPWVNVMGDCDYADSDYADCGSCIYFRCELEGDLIGICENEKLRKITHKQNY